MSSSVSRAEQLKAQANAFHLKGQYEKARIKYSEAIREGDKSLNAVLYANRAASSLAMNEYLDAALDAKKAVALDPKYSKAWARLAAANLALSSFDKSIEAWETALSCLPSENLSATENVLKLQCEAGLKSTHEAKENLISSEHFTSFDKEVVGDKLPWHRALAMEKSLMDQSNVKSSAWVIMNAYRDFKHGVDTMSATKRKIVGDQEHYYGIPTGITDISNAILRDTRVFHMDNNWLDMYNKQVTFEGISLSGWVEGGAKTVQEEARKRLKTQGWTSVRPSLSITVRAWIMKGFIGTSMTRETSGLEFLRRALDVLEWGRKVWKNVSPDDRGVIFDQTFIRGVRRLLMNAIMKTTTYVGGSMEDMAEMAHDMIAEVTANPPKSDAQFDPGFWSSFWIYPVADAFSVLGYYHMQTAFSCKNTEERGHHFAEAAKYYIDAGRTFPEDDEHHAYFLKIALEAYCQCSAPLRVTLPLCKRIRLAIPKMQKIWGFSQMTPMRDVSLQQALDFESTCLKAILDGVYTLESKVKLDALMLRQTLLPATRI